MNYQMTDVVLIYTQQSLLPDIPRSKLESKMTTYMFSPHRESIQQHDDVDSSAAPSQ